jgi:hypothetical protein
MTSKVSPFGARIAFVDLTTGRLTDEAFRWLVREILKRVGGTEAMTNAELQAAIDALTAGEQIFQPAPFQQIPADVLQHGQDAASPADVFQHVDAVSLGDVTFQT